MHLKSEDIGLMIAMPHAAVAAKPGTGTSYVIENKRGNIYMFVDRPMHNTKGHKVLGWFHIAKASTKPSIIVHLPDEIAFNHMPINMSQITDAVSPYGGLKVPVDAVPIAKENIPEDLMPISTGLYMRRADLSKLVP